MLEEVTNSNLDDIFVIETNISLNNFEDMADFQSRVIKVKSWEAYKSEIRNAESVCRQAFIGNLYGNSVPKHATVEVLQEDEFHMVAKVTNYVGVKTKKMAYLVR